MVMIDILRSHNNGHPPINIAEILFKVALSTITLTLILLPQWMLMMLNGYILI